MNAELQLQKVGRCVSRPPSYDWLGTLRETRHSRAWIVSEGEHPCPPQTMNMQQIVSVAMRCFITKAQPEYGSGLPSGVMSEIRASACSMGIIAQAWNDAPARRRTARFFKECPAPETIPKESPEAPRRKGSLRRRCRRETGRRSVPKKHRYDS